MYDLIIIGAGPAGMNAILYAKRMGINAILIEKNEPGGLINTTNKVDNYLGVGSVSGKELVDMMKKHLKEFNIDYKKEEVLKITNLKYKKVIKTDKNVYETKSIIICSGRVPNKGKNNLFTKLEGNGISYCAVKDADKYKDKTVGIIGGGNSAFEEGLYLTKYAKKVYFFIRKKYIKADEVFINQAKNNKKVEILLDSNITDLIMSNNKLKGVIINGEKKLNIDGLFLYIGYKPNSNYLADLNITNEKGYIEVNKDMKTKLDGIYAAGDILQKKLYQIITAVSEGAIATMSVKKYLKKLEKNK